MRLVAISGTISSNSNIIIINKIPSWEHNFDSDPHFFTIAQYLHTISVIMVIVCTIYRIAAHLWVISYYCRRYQTRTTTLATICAVSNSSKTITTSNSSRRRRKRPTGSMDKSAYNTVHSQPRHIYTWAGIHPQQNGTYMQSSSLVVNNQLGIEYICAYNLFPQMNANWLVQPCICSLTALLLPIHARDGILPQVVFVFFRWGGKCVSKWNFTASIVDSQLSADEVSTTTTTTAYKTTTKMIKPCHLYKINCTRLLDGLCLLPSWPQSPAASLCHNISYHRISIISFKWTRRCSVEEVNINLTGILFLLPVASFPWQPIQQHWDHDAMKIADPPASLSVVSW